MPKNGHDKWNIVSMSGIAGAANSWKNPGVPGSQEVASGATAIGQAKGGDATDQAMQRA